MLLGCIADDFTGASDLANTLSKNGMATVQFVGVPKGAGTVACEAGVVALKTRSIAPAEAVRRSRDALQWLQAQGCEQILFKYCSTFDSTPDGNIGPVAEALLDALGGEVAVVCPAFPEAGRTIYQGHLFVNDLLLSESGMENHPLNPMIDPNIRRWLRRQTCGEVGLVAYDTVRRGPAAIRDALAAEAQQGRRLSVLDALTIEDLRVIASAIADQKLVTGGSGIAVGLPDNFRRAGKLGVAATLFRGISGPGVVLSGSCSTTSRAQVAQHLRSHPGLAIEAAPLLAGDLTVEQALAFVEAHRHRAPIIHSTAEPERVKADQQRFGSERVAGAIEQFFGQLALRLVAKGITRLAVGGGETSGAVVTALGLDHLAIGPEIDPRIPALASCGAGRDIRLALKSGNFGGVDFYDKALRIMQAP